jgi:hypothetical protein
VFGGNYIYHFVKCEGNTFRKLAESPESRLWDPAFCFGDRSEDV